MGRSVRRLPFFDQEHSQLYLLGSERVLFPFYLAERHDRSNRNHVPVGVREDFRCRGRVDSRSVGFRFRGASFAGDYRYFQPGLTFQVALSVLNCRNHVIFRVRRLTVAFCQSLVFPGFVSLLFIFRCSLASRPGTLTPGATTSTSFGSRVGGLILPSWVFGVLSSVTLQVNFVVWSPSFTGPPGEVVTSKLRGTVGSTGTSPGVHPMCSGVSYTGLSPLATTSGASLSAVSSTKVSLGGLNSKQTAEGSHTIHTAPMTRRWISGRPLQPRPR